VYLRAEIPYFESQMEGNLGQLGGTQTRLGGNHEPVVALDQCKKYIIN
jgi:hypothetical protein